MNIVFLSHTSMVSPFVVGSHRLARQFVRLGHRVLHMSPPFTLAHAADLTNPWTRKRLRHSLQGAVVREGVIDFSPLALLPWSIAKRQRSPLRAFAAPLNGSLQRVVERYGIAPVDVVFIDEPRLAGVVSGLQARCVTYRPTDLYAEMRSDASIVGAEQWLVRHADTFVATSEPVAAHLRQLGAEPVTVLENGVDLDAFDAALDDDAVEALLPPLPRAVYVGAFDKRFDFASVRAAAIRSPAVSFALIGPADRGEQAELAGLPNVRFLGSQPSRTIPSFLRRCQVAMLPLTQDKSNAGRSPMKIYEYAAAGLRVVATATDELARRRLRFVDLVDDAEHFAACVATSVESASSAGVCKLALEEASRHSWTAKCNTLLDLSIKTSAPQESGDLLSMEKA